MTASFVLDDRRLGEYLSAHLPALRPPLTSVKFEGGQSNPTYRLDTDTGSYVLRRKPPGALLRSAHAIDREFRVMHALAGSDVPVARMLHYCSDTSVIGSEFFVMEHVSGVVHWDPALPGMSATERRLHYRELCRVLAALHSVDVDAVGLADFGKPGNYYVRQIGRWSEQYLATSTESLPDMDFLLHWLPEHVPPDDGQCALVHGDYRIDNLIFQPGAARVLALLDWELSTLGHPLADLAYQCMQLRMPPDSAIRGLDGLDRNRLGIPDEKAYCDLYCELAGIEQIDNWSFYLAFSFFRMAAILQGVKKRALDGNASNRRALEYGTLVTPLAQRGVQAALSTNAEEPTFR